MSDRDERPIPPTPAPGVSPQPSLAEEALQRLDAIERRLTQAVMLLAVLTGFAVLGVVAQVLPWGVLLFSSLGR